MYTHIYIYIPPFIVCRDEAMATITAVLVPLLHYTLHCIHISPFEGDIKQF